MEMLNLMDIQIKQRERKVMMPRKIGIQRKVLLDSIASVQLSPYHALNAIRKFYKDVSKVECVKL